MLRMCLAISFQYASTRRLRDFGCLIIIKFLGELLAGTDASSSLPC